MPEGDVVWNTARRLHEALAGRALTRSDFRVPRFATVNLAGQDVTETVSRGKHLLTRTGKGLTVHTHLRMEGSWRIQPPSGKGHGYQVRLILANEQWEAVGYQLGIVEVLRTTDEHRVVGHLGPDLLGADWDADEAVRRLAAEPARPVGEALLDQRNLAGIGNIYMAETLFLNSVNPTRPVGEIPDLHPLVDRARELLDANKDRVGAGRRWVYGRRGKPCRRCGRPVAGIRRQDRITYWCPSCQSG